jgi:hypothetical protein
MRPSAMREFKMALALGLGLAAACFGAALFAARFIAH